MTHFSDAQLVESVNGEFEQSPHSPAQSSNTEFNRLLNNLPESILDSFTDDQLIAMEWALRRNLNSRHYIDFRSSIPILRTGFYLVLLAGREKRSKTRLRAEGQISLFKAGIVYFAITILLAVMGLVGFVIFLYAIKSILGIDIFEEVSILHPFLFED